MKRKFDFVDCPAIRKSLVVCLPDEIKVIEVWEGTMRNDNTFKVYVRLTQVDGHNPSFFSEVILADLKEICGELIDVEIKGMRSLEFGFALPLTSHYYND